MYRPEPSNYEPSSSPPLVLYYYVDETPCGKCKLLKHTGKMEVVTPIHAAAFVLTSKGEAVQVRGPVNVEVCKCPKNRKLTFVAKQFGESCSRRTPV